MNLRIAIIDGNQEQDLKLLPNTKVNFDFPNPAFDFSTAIPGAFHMGLKLPISGNETAFSFAHHIETDHGDKLYDIRFYYHDGQIFNGKLLLESCETDFNQGFFECSLLVDGYASLIEGQTIRDAVDDLEDLGADTAAIATEIKAINASSYPSERFCFPTIYNAKFYDEQLEGFSNFINLFDQDTQTFLSNAVGGNYAICPSVYLLHVLEKCFTHYGYSVDKGSVFDDPRLKRRIIYGSHALDKYYSEESMEVEVTVAQDMDSVSDENIDWGQINYDYTTEGASTGETVFTTASYIIYDAVIEIKFGEVTASNVEIHLESNYFAFSGVVTSGSTIILHEFNDPFVLNLSVAISTTGGQAEVLPGSTLRFQKYGGEPVNEWLGQFTLGRCLPKLPIADFLSMVKANWGIACFIDSLSKSVALRFVKDLPNQLPLEISGISEQRQTEYVRPKTNKFAYSNNEFIPIETDFLGTWSTLAEAPPAYFKKFIYILNEGAHFEGAENESDDGYYWKKRTTGVPTFLTGSGEINEINLGYELPTMEVKDDEDDPDGNGNDVLVPIESHVGSGDYLETRVDDWPFRVLVYHGLQPGESDDYPLASVFASDYNGDDLGDSMILENEGNGCIEYFWDGADQLAYGPTILVSTLPKNIKASPTELLHSVIRHNGRNFLVLNVDITYGDKITPVNLTLLRL